LIWHPSLGGPNVEGFLLNDKCGVEGSSIVRLKVMGTSSSTQNWIRWFEFIGLATGILLEESDIQYKLYMDD
jgi:hypothetical protein